jgi:hypothetical protein
MREILNYFISHQRETKPWGLCEYSAHDTTLLATSSMMGITIPSPNFTGYYLFELYDDNMVAIYFNPDPLKMDIAELVPRQIHRGPHYRTWSNYPEGLITLEDFVALLQ